MPLSQPPTDLVKLIEYYKTNYQFDTRKEILLLALLTQIVESLEARLDALEA